MDAWHEPPMIGVYWRGLHRLREPFLKSSVEYQNLKKREQNWKYCESASDFSKLIDLSVNEDRKIVAYSNHEKKVMNAIFPDRKELIKEIYVDANMKNWFKKNRGTTFRKLKRNKKGSITKTLD